MGSLTNLSEAAAPRPLHPSPPVFVLLYCPSQHVPPLTYVVDPSVSYASAPWDGPGGQELGLTVVSSSHGAVGAPVGLEPLSSHFTDEESRHREGKSLCSHTAQLKDLTTGLQVSEPFSFCYNNLAFVTTPSTDSAPEFVGG